MILYHGSENIIEKPIYGAGRADNDYGRGFYCTSVWEMAAEWASFSKQGGFVNCYEIDTARLTVFDMMDGSCHILHWMALLLSNRRPRLSSAVEKRGMEFILSHYSVNIEGYDAVVGFRADDSYFSFSRAFLSNTITVEQLKKVMSLGELGVQHVIKSKKAFEKLHFIKTDIIGDAKYYHSRIKRDEAAREAYQSMIDEADVKGHYLSDLMKGVLEDANSILTELSL